MGTSFIPRRLIVPNSHFFLLGPRGTGKTAWCDYTRSPHQLQYWHTRTGVEVDFIVYGDSGLFAVEVKNSNRIRPEDLRGLGAFAEDYPQSRRYFLYRGKERMLIDGILCLPCEEFLTALQPDSFPE